MSDLFGGVLRRLISWVDLPQALRIELRHKIEREGVSLRALTLRLWKEWVER